MSIVTHPLVIDITARIRVNFFGSCFHDLNRLKDMMTGDSPGLDELTTRIGHEWPPRKTEVSSELVRRFILAIEDPSPLWQDIAPPMLTAILGFDQFADTLLSMSSLGTLIHGKTEFECYRPVKPGDVITVSTRISDIRQRQGKTGKIAFVTFDTSYTNKVGELVARCQQLVIGYQGKEL